VGLETGFGSHLVSGAVRQGDRRPQHATLKLDIEGQTRIEEAEGNGPVDAVFYCIKALVPHEAKLELYLGALNKIVMKRQRDMSAQAAS
jgi:LeuA-like protein with dimerisation domain